MRAADKWLKTIDEYWSTGGDSYYCWCPPRGRENGSGHTLSCYLYSIAIEFESRTARIHLQFIPEARDLNQQVLYWDGKYRLELFPALTLFPGRLNDRELTAEIGKEATAAVDKFFRTNGLKPFPETEKLIRAIACRLWYLAKKGTM